MLQKTNHIRILFYFLLGFIIYASSCYPKETNTRQDQENISNLKDSTSLSDSLVEYATTLIGTPYVYGSTNPDVGFDCSGFITHVFNHFNIDVPRSSVEFTNYGLEIPATLAKPGDLILFTGTDSTIRIVGHMGIIVSNSSEGISFIHSSSGKADGVVITPLNDYYMGRFVKVIRVLS